MFIPFLYANSGNFWTPAELTTDLFIDASNTSTITENIGVPGNVAQIDDLSGNDRHLVQTIESQQPVTGTRTINGLNAIDFTPIDALLTSSNATWLNNTEYSIYAVVEFDDVANAYICGTTTAGANQGLHIGHLNSNTWQIAQFADDANHPYIFSSGPKIMENIFNNPTSDLYVDGDFKSNRAQPVNPLNTSAPFAVGRGFNSSKQLDGAIGEIIVLTTNLNTDDRQLLEGYLAWKWGTVARLPITHPYKTDGSKFGFFAPELDFSVPENSQYLPAI